MKRILLGLLCLTWCSSNAFAQIIDIGLSRTGSTVKVSSTNVDVTDLNTGNAGLGGDGIQNLNITVTIKYPSGISGLSVSAPTNHNGLNFSLQSNTTNGGFVYRVYAASYIGTDPPRIDWIGGGAAVDLFSISFSGSASTATIEIGNDAYTSTVLGDYYFEQATDYTGGLDPQNLTGVPLPVTLVRFDVAANGATDAKLTWQTATETNNRGFFVERSIDGKQWEVVNFVATLTPGGNSKILTDYQYFDANVYKSWNGINTYYYRLRQQDFNGTEEYVGGVKAVRFGGAEAAAVLTVFPNPANSVINLTVKNGVATRYIISDMNGRPVAAAAYAPRVNVGNLKSGNYQVRVFDVTGAVLGTQQVVIAR
jgi:hypothetical protein